MDVCGVLCECMGMYGCVSGVCGVCVSGVCEGMECVCEVYMCQCVVYVWCVCLVYRYEVWCICVSSVCVWSGV